MNRGLMLKAFRETWLMTLGLAMALLIVEGVLGYVLPTFQEQFSTQLLQIKFFQKFISAMLGADVAGPGGTIGPAMFMSVPWVHPVPLALVWAHAIVCCTRVPAGEVDRGTIDVLLGLPVSRWQVFLSESLVWIVGGVVILMCSGVGNMIGGAGIAPEFRATPARLVVVLINLLCLYLAVGGITWMVSSLSDRRGRAMTAMFVIVLGFFLLNYLAQLWKPAERLSVVSALHYYRPLFILGDGAWPIRDMAVLLCAAVVFWLVGGAIFARRDLTTT